jgi:tetratricopeptide (TPR) repeat protein
MRGCALLIALWLTPARADERQEARAHFDLGTRAFDLGAYDEAIHEYELAYRLLNDPALLYNIAQAYRLHGDAAHALHFYRIYLYRVADAANRAEVEAKIEELSQLVKLKATTETMPPNSAILPSPEPRAPPPPETAQVVVARHPPRTKTIAGGVLAGVGLALVGVAIGLHAAAGTASSQLTSDSQALRPFDSQLYSRGQALDRAGIACDCIGAAAAVTGAVLLAVAGRHR